MSSDASLRLGNLGLATTIFPAVVHRSESLILSSSVEVPPEHNQRGALFAFTFSPLFLPPCVIAPAVRARKPWPASINSYPMKIGDLGTAWRSGMAPAAPTRSFVPREAAAVTYHLYWEQQTGGGGGVNAAEKREAAHSIGLRSAPLLAMVQREPTRGGPGSGLRPGRRRFVCQLPLWLVL
jgi:hypothetical protein